MSNSIGFFTPIRYGDEQAVGSRDQQWLKSVSHYTNPFGQTAQVIPGHRKDKSEGVLFLNEPTSYLITALKIASYLLVLPLVVALITQAILLNHRHFHQIDIRKQITNFQIPPEATALLQQLLPQISAQLPHEELVWPTKQHTRNKLSFSLKAYPGFVFTRIDPNSREMHNSQEMGAREIAQNAVSERVRAKKACLLHHLHLLVVPKTQAIAIGNHTFIVEQRPLVDAQEQERLYERYAGEPALNQALLQVTAFIAYTGLSSVNWETIPIVDAPPGEKEKGLPNKRVAVLECGYSFERNDRASALYRAAEGLFGDSNPNYFHPTSGLIQCLRSEEEIDSVIARARTLGVKCKGAAKAKEDTLNLIQRNRAVDEFHQKNGIWDNPKKLIVNQLSSDTEFPGRGLLTTTVGKVAKDIIDQINQAITEAPEKGSLRQRRWIQLNLFMYDQSGTIYSYKAQDLLTGIFNAFVAHKYIFDWKRKDSYYYVQC
jgi:hypothetical protein